MLTLIFTAILLVVVVPFTIGLLYGLYELDKAAHPYEAGKWEALRYNEWVKKQ